MENNNLIPGGYFLVARELFKKEIWKFKPLAWKVIWIYIIGKVNWTPNGKFLRGEGYFNFAEERRDIGLEITADSIKKFLSYARKKEMIDTSRSTRGLHLKVLGYYRFQNPDNYKSTYQSTSQAREEHEPSTPIQKNIIKKEYNNYTQEVFNYFVDRSKKTSTFRLTDIRSRLIGKRLAEGFTVEDMKKAIDNFVADDWFKKRESKHIDLLYCIGIQPNRGIDHLDKWLNSERKVSQFEARIKLQERHKAENERLQGGVC